MVVSVGIALIQLAGSFFVKPHSEKKADEGEGEEERLLPCMFITNLLLVPFAY